ncbi:hypothetical protein LMG27177_06667 [Paraburkholderia fynbosensis]|uniref:Uncharacterized protein n=1 Tax=Paraburkholderia fynbosensis TaxID=1200993 RepID=A0A6J5H1R1_9BURK|nr:hypothetical protein LMG27177_06667 [Paraburkholderia fynbosensis]
MIWHASRVPGFMPNAFLTSAGTVVLPLVVSRDSAMNFLLYQLFPTLPTQLASLNPLCRGRANTRAQLRELALRSSGVHFDRYAAGTTGADFYDVARLDAVTSRVTECEKKSLSVRQTTRISLRRAVRPPVADT